MKNAGCPAFFLQHLTQSLSVEDFDVNLVSLVFNHTVINSFPRPGMVCQIHVAPGYVCFRNELVDMVYHCLVFDQVDPVTAGPFVFRPVLWVILRAGIEHGMRPGIDRHLDPLPFMVSTDRNDIVP